MSDKTVEVKVVPCKGTQTILWGDAPAPLPNPVSVKIDGNIDAPSRFIDKRMGLIKKDSAYVMVNRKAMTIILVTDETNPLNTVIAGKLYVDPDLAEFQINANRLFTVKELAALLRMRRQFFREREQHQRTMKSLGEFSVRTAVEFTEKDDRKGNTELLRKRASTVDLDFEFVLDVPVYKGSSNKTFRVEILADVTDGGVKLWLESIELAEVMKSELDKIFAVEIEKLLDFVVIEQ